MARKYQWSLRREMRHLEWWLNPEKVDFRRDQPRRKLEAELNEYGPHTLGYIALRLESIGLWESHVGAYTVLKGDDSGWEHLRLALEHYGWHLRIEYGEYELALSQGHEKDTSLLTHGLATRCLAQAIALKDDVFADWCGERMLRSAVNPKGFFHDWMYYTPFHPFMARLYALWRSRKVDTEKGLLRNLGIYQGLFDGWTDDRAYATALLRACDFHCERTQFCNEEYREFTHTPIDVFAGEILAVQRVRQELLGSAPDISHPLLDTPLGRLPASIPLPQDELLARVIARVNAELPEVNH